MLLVPSELVKYVLLLCDRQLFGTPCIVGAVFQFRMIGFNCVYMCTLQNQNKLDIWDAETGRDPLQSVKAHTRAVRSAETYQGVPS